MSKSELEYRTVSQCISADYASGWNDATMQAEKLIAIKNAEIERLQAYYNDMQSAIYSFREDHAKVKFFKGEIRAEAIKEFADRLCADRVVNDPVVIAVTTELAMGGDQDG